MFPLTSSARFEGIIILLFVVLSLAALAVGSHAKDNGKTPAWGLLVALTGILGLVLYAISLASD